MLIQLDPEGSGWRRDPLHRQIYDHLRQAILAGDLESGRRLPSSRDLARELEVSRNVVVVAYEQLLAEGYVEGRVGAGTFVASALPELGRPTRSAARKSSPGAEAPRRHRLSAFARRAVALSPFSVDPDRHPAPRYDFRYGGGQPDAQGMKVWRRLLMRHAEQLRYGYAPTEGHPALREEIVYYARQSRGVRCEQEQVIVVNGSQQGLDLAARVLLEPGDRVLIEEPHYQGARQAFAGLRDAIAGGDRRGHSPPGKPSEGRAPTQGCPPLRP